MMLKYWSPFGRVYGVVEVSDIAPDAAVDCAWQKLVEVVEHRWAEIISEEKK